MGGLFFLSSLRIVAIAVLLYAAARAGAGELDRRLAAPPQADSSPTGFACTVDTLISGADCVFEGDPNLAPAAGTTSWSTASASETLCAAASRPPSEARPDAGVRSACEADVSRSLERCARPGTVLLDPGGRFLPSARACYAAIGNALARARTLAATVAPCCRCLAQAGCGDAFTCVRRGLVGFLSGAEGNCAVRACHSSCGAYLPPAQDEKDEDGIDKTAPTKPAAPRLDRPAEEI